MKWSKTAFRAEITLKYLKNPSEPDMKRRLFERKKEERKEKKEKKRKKAKRKKMEKNGKIINNGVNMNR